LPIGAVVSSELAAVVVSSLATCGWRCVCERDLVWCWDGHASRAGGAGGGGGWVMLVCGFSGSVPGRISRGAAPRSCLQLRGWPRARARRTDLDVRDALLARGPGAAPSSARCRGGRRSVAATGRPRDRGAPPWASARRRRHRLGLRAAPVMRSHVTIKRGTASVLHGRVAGGIAAPGSHGSGHDSLPSPSSSDQPSGRADPPPVGEKAGLSHE
jgi:hypothetical protein